MTRAPLTKSRESEYFYEAGLRTLTGLEEELWDFAILKELLDNALDAIDKSKIKSIEINHEEIEGSGSLAIYENGSYLSVPKV